MRRVGTVEEWGRRQELATELLAGVAAVVAAGLGVAFLVFGKLVPGLVSFGVALVAALVRGVIALQLAAAKKRREAIVLGDQLKAEIAPISKVEPTKIGVELAAREETHLDVDVPEYVPRRGVDEELNQALREALDGSGREIVVVSGRPKVGKSRTAFEALRHLDDEGVDLRLIAPSGGDAVRALLERVEGSPGDRSGPRHVLWLDDLEVFVSEGVGLKELAAWRDKGAIVVATYGGKAAKQDAGDESGGVALLADKILLQARRIYLRRTTPEELTDLPESLSRVNRRAIDDYGLAAALVAAPELELRLKSPHRDSEPASAAGAAIVYTAINWARCGRTDAISKELVRELWPTHLQEVTLAKGEDVFEAGLAWALDPVAGSVALLKGDDSFRAYDYIRAAAATDPDTPRISEATWRYALATADPGQAFGVGMAALAAGRTSDAESALTTAAADEEHEIAAEANFKLSRLLRDKGDEEGAEAHLRRARELGSSEALAYSGREAAEREASEEVSGPPLEVREAIERQLRETGELSEGATIKWKDELYEDLVEEGDGAAAEEMGLALMHEGKLREAEEMLRKAIAFDYIPATVALGLVLEDLEDLEGAEAAFREAAEHDLSDGAFNLGVLLKEKGDLPGSEEALRKAAALGSSAGANNLGILLQQRGDLAGAEASYRQAAERGFQNAGRALGGLLAGMGRMDEAEVAYRDAAERGEISGAVALAGLLIEEGDIDGAREAFRPFAEANETDASLLVATVLEEMGNMTAAEVAYREAADRGIGLAAFNLGRMLEEQGRTKEAEVAFAEAAELEAGELTEIDVADREDDDDEADEGGEAGLVPVR